MSFAVGLKNLRIDCIVGVHPHEREKVQPVFVDVRLEGSFEDAARDESLDSGVDYEAVAVLLEELLIRRQFRLIETLAVEAATAIFARFARVDRVTLEVRKPAAVPKADCAFVAHTASRC